MRKNLIVTLVIMVTGVFIVSTCGKNQQSSKYNDPNCIIGHEEKAVIGKFIGKFSKLTSKAQMINVKVGKMCSTISFNNSTKWIWNESIKSIKDLKKKKGQCITISTKKEGNKLLATEVAVLPPFKVPEKQIIKIAELKTLMKGIPNSNKSLTIVDNRPKPKFLAGSIPGAINIPMGELKKGPGFDKLPQQKDSLIVFYCGGLHCKLSPFSAHLASKKGYTNIRVYHDGYPNWKKSCMPGYSTAKSILSSQKKEIPMILIDIRPKASDSHIPGAIAFDAGKINVYKSQFPTGKDKKRAPFIVYGQSPSDDAKAFDLAQKITALGYKNVTVLKGGFDAYKKDGKAVSNQLISKINYIHKNPPGYVSAKDFVAMIDKSVSDDVVFLDVRENSEVSGEPGITLLGAQNVPLGNIEENISKLNKSKNYYVFCSSGTRAEIARNLLADKGFTSFYVAAPVEGYEDEGITLAEKFKISPDKISQFKKKRLMTKPQ